MSSEFFKNSDWKINRWQFQGKANEFAFCFQGPRNLIEVYFDSQSQLKSLLLSITAKEDRSVGTVDLKWKLHSCLSSCLSQNGPTKLVAWIFGGQSTVPPLHGSLITAIAQFRLCSFLKFWKEFILKLIWL